MKHIIIFILGISLNLSNAIPVERLNCTKTSGNSQNCSLSCDFMGDTVKCGPAGAGGKYSKCFPFGGNLDGTSGDFLVIGNSCA